MVSLISPFLPRLYRMVSSSSQEINAEAQMCGAQRRVWRLPNVVVQGTITHMVFCFVLFCLKETI